MTKSTPNPIQNLSCTDDITFILWYSKSTYKYTQLVVEYWQYIYNNNPCYTITDLLIDSYKTSDNMKSIHCLPSYDNELGTPLWDCQFFNSHLFSIHFNLLLSQYIPYNWPVLCIAWLRTLLLIFYKFKGGLNLTSAVRVDPSLTLNLETISCTN